MALVDAIRRETEGNPLFVGEVVRLLAAEGSLATVDVDSLWALGIPQGVREVIGRRLGAFHVRLDGPPERRARRGAAWEATTLESATAHMTKTDVARMRYVQRLYGRDPADASLYHLVVDSTVLPIDAVVSLVASAAESAWNYDDTNLQGDIAAMQARLGQAST